MNILIVLISGIIFAFTELKFMVFSGLYASIYNNILGHSVLQVNCSNLNNSTMYWFLKITFSIALPFNKNNHISGIAKPILMEYRYGRDKSILYSFIPLKVSFWLDDFSLLFIWILVLIIPAVDTYLPSTAKNSVFKCVLTKN